MKLLRLTVQSALIAVAASTILSGCSINTVNDAPASSSSASRVKLYESIATLAQDSTEVVIGHVNSQEVRTDLDTVTDFTVSDILVNQVLKSANGTAPNDTLVVRQVGSSDQAPPAPLLQPSKSYLLYLTPSGLSGNLASEYYVTGGNAGLYASDTNPEDRSIPTFVQMMPTEGESLPTELTPETALGAS